MNNAIFDTGRTNEALLGVIDDFESIAFCSIRARSEYSTELNNSSVGIQFESSHVGSSAFGAPRVRKCSPKTFRRGEAFE